MTSIGLLRCPFVKELDVCIEEGPSKVPAGPGKPEGPHSRLGYRQNFCGIQYPRHPQGWSGQDPENPGFPSGIINTFLEHSGLSFFKKKFSRGAGVAQSAKHLTLNFGSSHDLMVHEIEPRVGFCADRAEPAWGSLSPPLSAPPPLMLAHVHALSLSLSQNK